MQSSIQNNLAQGALQGLQTGLQGVAQNALQNGIQSVSTVVPGAAALQGAASALGPAALPGSAPLTAVPAPDAATAPLGSAPLPGSASLIDSTKAGMVQLLTELVKDKDFKQLIMEKISDPVFVSMQEKLDKSLALTEKVRSLHAAFQTAFDAAKPDEVQSIVKKFNTDLKDVFEKETAAVASEQTGGARQKTNKRNRRPVTRRRFSSRVFQRTLGRTRNFQ